MSLDGKLYSKTLEIWYWTDLNVYYLFAVTLGQKKCFFKRG